MSGADLAAPVSRDQLGVTGFDELAMSEARERQFVPQLS
jgi:hypothetical protein